eukprot:6211219-Pleurochrysis_carterae.AAC.3
MAASVCLFEDGSASLSFSDMTRISTSCNLLWACRIYQSQLRVTLLAHQHMPKAKPQRPGECMVFEHPLSL